MPFERILGIDVWVLVNNPQIDILQDGSVVTLACGHNLFTKARNRARCPRCFEMLRRSITDGSADYDAFRNRGDIDTMEWPADPMRIFHEQYYARECKKHGVIKDRDEGKLTWDEAAKKLIALDKN